MIQDILTFAVRQRYFILLLTLGLAALGLYALQRLPIDAVPDITNRQVQINALAPGLSPFEVEKQVTFPIETALAGVPGLRSTRSLSRNGFAQVTAIFDDAADIFFARQQVNERLGEARENLPPGVEPKMGPISTGLGEIYMWVVDYQSAAARRVSDGAAGWQADGSYLTPEGARLRSELERAAYLRTVQDWIIRPQLKAVPGVAGVDSIGGYVQQYHVQPDPAKLIAKSLSFDAVAEALAANNRSMGAGYLERNGEGYVISVDGRLEAPEQIGAVTVAVRDGVPILLKDLAEIAIGRELRTGAATSDGREVVVGTALMLIGQNSRTVAAAVDAKMQEITKSLPPGIEARAVLNRTKLVDATIQTVEHNLGIGALLVIVILFAMLGNLRAAFITALVIPVTMLMTATGMLGGRISANLMSLGALDFGLIVDGAVIITENCLRRLQLEQEKIGHSLNLEQRLSVVIDAAKQMIQPTVFGQAIIIIVYLPLLTLSGVEGKMFEPMALTVIIALVAAFILSLTFVPAMLALFITKPVGHGENLIVSGLKAMYRPALLTAMRRPGRVIGGAAVLLLLSALLFIRLGQEFIPTLDEKDIAMHALRIPSAGLTQSSTMQMAVERTVRSFDEVAFVYSKTGTAEIASDPMPVNVSDTFIILKPQSEWPDPNLSKAELVTKIEAAVRRVPGNNFEFTQPIQMRFNELLAGVRGDIAVKVHGDDFDALLRTANQIASLLRTVAGAQDVKVEQASGLPFLNIKIDRAMAARFGLTIQEIHDVIGLAIGGRTVGAVFEGDRRFDIVVRLPDRLRNDIEVLRNLPLPLPAGVSGRAQSIPLREVAKLSFTEGPNQISREDGKRRIVVQANVRGRDIGSVVAEAQSQIAAQIQLPAGYWLKWGGQFENLVAAKQRLTYVVPACFLLIFLLLYAALRSVRDALIVFSGVPLALSGGVFALFLRDMPFSISAAVGFIAVSGVAVLNGLVMMSYIREVIGSGLSQLDGIFEGALTRLRPVIMTALVASLGFLPMAIATGTGAEVQKPLATVVIGGLITSTLLTLLVLPALCVRFRVQEAVHRSWRGFHVRHMEMARD